MAATFGEVFDWFGFSADEAYAGKLIPISSDSGDNIKRVCVTNARWVSGEQRDGAGRYSAGVDAVSGVWRNPSVTYRVVEDVTFACNLGKAFAKTGTAISGYMINDVAVDTQIGEFPTVKVEAVANEGADAINLFAVSIPIVAAAHAENLNSALGGDAILQRSTLRAHADPVVCAENNFPCASDVVRGRYTFTATVIAQDSADVPSAAGGFTLVGSPERTVESGCAAYSVTMQKEIT